MRMYHQSMILPETVLDSRSRKTSGRRSENPNSCESGYLDVLVVDGPVSPVALVVDDAMSPD